MSMRINYAWTDDVEAPIDSRLTFLALAGHVKNHGIHKSN